MDYGKSAYTKVLELEKRIGNGEFENQIKIYDSGTKSNVSFFTEYIIQSDNLIVEKDNRLYFKLSFDLLSNIASTVKAEYFIDSVIVATKEIQLQENQMQSVFLDFTHVPSNNEVSGAFVKLTAMNSEANITLENYKLIVLNALSSNDSSKSEIELRTCKTPDNTFIISYNQDGVVYACEIDENSVNLEFIPIIYAKNHCFAFDKSDNLHLFYVDTNNFLYDKLVGSVFNDALIADSVSNVYAIKTSNYNSSDIAVCYISDDLKNVFYFTFENQKYTTIKNLIVPNLEYIDLSMVAGDKFVFLVITSTSGSSFLLKSAYEPLSNCNFENITSNLAVIAQKYYTVGEYSNELIDTISASMILSSNIVLNYEKIIEDISKDTVSASISTNFETYELPTDEQVLYTVVIDKADRQFTDRCVYADDALNLQPVVNTADAGVLMNGWDERFPLNKIKPCALRDGEFLGYLNPNDYTKFEDGSDVNSDAEDNFIDIMVEFPKIYYFIENVDPYIYVHISNHQIDENYKCYAYVYDGKEADKIYISAYHCGYKNYNGQNTMFSYTNTYPNCYDVVPSNDYASLLENKSDKYRILNLDQTTLLQCLFIILFKSTGSHAVLGLGNNNSAGGIFENGYCDHLGMFSASLSSPVPCKMFGIENIYGNCYSRVEGFSTISYPYSDIYILKKRNPYSSVPLNKAGDGYEEFFNPEFDNSFNDSFYLVNPYGNTEFGFLPMGLKYNGIASNYLRYYCDSTFFGHSYGAWWGGDAKASNGGGMFHFFRECDLNYNGGSRYYGYRIVYYPV